MSEAARLMSQSYHFVFVLLEIKLVPLIIIWWIWFYAKSDFVQNHGQVGKECWCALSRGSYLLWTDLHLCR